MATKRDILDEIWEQGRTRATSLNQLYSWGSDINSRLKEVGIVPPLDQFRIIMTDAPRVVIKAGAGTGKTTTVQARNYRKQSCGLELGKYILNIVYNDKNTPDIKSKYAKLIGTTFADKICNARTFNSFASEWITEYRYPLKLNAKVLITSPFVLKQFMGIASDVAFENKDEFVTLNLLKLYNLVHERLEFEFVEREDTNGVKYMDYFSINWLFENNPEFIALKLPFESVGQSFTMFNKLKSDNAKYDYMDQTVNLYRLTLLSQPFLDRIKVRYHSICIDECQDFTPLMGAIVRNMDIEEIVFMGDKNQSIYEFKGADVEQKFLDEFECISLDLITNRRSPKKIVDFCNKVKDYINPEGAPLLSLSDGGDINYFSYSSRKEEMDTVIEKLRTWDCIDIDTVICFRNQAYSNYITFRLLREKIPFTLGNGNAPFSDKYSSSMYDMLRLLKDPYSDFYQKRLLFKLLPILTVKLITEIVDTNIRAQKRVAFWDLDFGDLKSNKSFQLSLDTLKLAFAKAEQNRTANEVFYLLKPLFLKNYWSKQQTPDFDELVEEVDSFMYVDEPFSELTNKVEDLIMYCGQSMNKQKGPYITTFHSLKGLEFNVVIAVGLDWKTFPQDKTHDCLFYVISSRAKKRSCYLFDRVQPSFYKGLLTGEIVRPAGLEIISDDLQALTLPELNSGGFEKILSSMQTFEKKEEFSKVKVIGDIIVEKNPFDQFDCLNEDVSNKDMFAGLDEEKESVEVSEPVIECVSVNKFKFLDVAETLQILELFE